MSAAEASDLREQLGDTFTDSEANEVGVDERRLLALRDSEKIVALGDGVYRWSMASIGDPDLIEIAERVPHATLCLETALAHHGLLEANPAVIYIAIPRGSTRPTLKASVRIHEFDPQTFDLGRNDLALAAGPPLGMYSAERSLIDIVRVRPLESSEVAWDALRRWLRRPGRNPAKLIELAREFPRAEPALRQALEVLL